jgi:hypothetical protein
MSVIDSRQQNSDEGGIMSGNEKEDDKACLGYHYKR